MLNPGVRIVMREDLEERWNAGIKEGIKEGIREGIIIGREEGRTEGRTEGRKEGIFNLVSVYRDEMGLDNEAITERIAKRCNLTREQAAHYVSAPVA